MEKQEIKIHENGNVQIGDIVLTENALKTLEWFQRENNYNIKQHIEMMAETICLITESVDSIDGVDEKTLYRMATDLSFLRSNLKDFLNPNETDVL